jgi:hypothetical protein
MRIKKQAFVRELSNITFREQDVSVRFDYSLSIILQLSKSKLQISISIEEDKEEYFSGTYRIFLNNIAFFPQVSFTNKKVKCLFEDFLKDLGEIEKELIKDINRNKSFINKSIKDESNFKAVDEADFYLNVKSHQSLEQLDLFLEAHSYHNFGFETTERLLEINKHLRIDRIPKSFKALNKDYLKIFLKERAKGISITNDIVDFFSEKDMEDLLFGGIDKGLLSTKRNKVKKVFYLVFRDLKSLKNINYVENLYYSGGKNILPLISNIQIKNLYLRNKNLLEEFRNLKQEGKISFIVLGF